MPREKKSRNCEHCGKEFTQARKDQKYCKAECRFDHFFDKRDSEKTRLEEQIKALQTENNDLRARATELEALQEVVAPVPKPKRERLKTPTP
jgi:predicted nuclease with TOPRIM domain